MKLHSIVILDLPHNGPIPLSLLEEKLRNLKGVADAVVNPVLEKVTVEFNPSLITIEKIRTTLRNGKGMRNSDKENPKNLGGGAS